MELQFSLQLCEENGMCEEDVRTVAAGHEMMKNIWRRIMALNPKIIKARGQENHTGWEEELPTTCGGGSLLMHP